MARLTARETLVLDALKRSADGNGGDFAFVEDLTRGADRLRDLSAKQVGALLTTLQTKRAITVHAPVTTDAGTFTQVTSDHFRG